MGLSKKKDSSMTDHPLRIVIVGGVAGGASAATRARRLNEHAQIILFEKDAHVSFANCGLPYYLGGEITDRAKLLVAKPELLEKRFRIQVRTRHLVTAIDRQRKIITVLARDSGQTFEQPYDKLILSPGAAPIVPPIDGVAASNVFTLRNMEDTDRIKTYLDSLPPRDGAPPQRVLVIGAGYIGLEMVEQLANLGIQPVLIELFDQVLPLFDPEMAHILETELHARGVQMHLGDGLEGLQTLDGLVTHAQLNSGALLHADAVVLGIGVRPNTRLAVDAGLTMGPSGAIKVNETQQTSDPDIYAVGDAVEYIFGPTAQPMRIALAGPANRSGRIAGEHAATNHTRTRMAPVWGTSIVRAFGQTAAMTGLTEKLARKLQRPAAAVIIQANHHAGYYPGARAMVLKLIYEPQTGKVLGAQAVGAEGVDKRIDIIATAMQFGATVRDLAKLDLAYAPPFGSAKDPLHMAAFSASNQLDGLVEFTPPDADLHDKQVLDVRFAAECATGTIDGSIHIPLDNLRDRLSELDPHKPTVTVCASGLRSYLAARILRQHGFKNVSDLTGGMTMRRHALPEQAPTAQPNV
jgi:NADPH-dependent 2,4-dienoyl-CoA reductase/sulfur reductase-like enzyme/rhodanese-related sulfurtransferase